MPTMTYEDYLNWRGEKVDKEQLQPGTQYFIERDRSFLDMSTIVYEGEFSHIDNNKWIRFNYLEYVVNPDDLSDVFLHSILNFSKVDHTITFYKQKYNFKEIRRDVDNMVRVLTHVLPEDAATIMALNTLYPDGVSRRAEYIKKKHSNNKSKGGKRKKHKSKTRKHKK